MIAAGSDALFRRLADALGDASLAADPRFADNPSRVRHREILVRDLSALTRPLKTADLLDRLRAAGVPAAPILSVDRVLEEPQTAASGMLLAVPHPRLPNYRAVGLPIRWHRQRPGVRRVPPLLGEHSADVLTWLGYTLDDVRNLQTKGVVQ
jgi:crotonobetainyl-CoA:carnitine CoA-transferase CaiB-like acyl-CoA transferase